MRNNTIINDTHIKHLPPHNGSYRVIGGIGLQLRKRGNSLRYIGRFKGREYPVGSPSKGFKVNDAVAKWMTLKSEPDKLIEKKIVIKEKNLKEIFDLFFSHLKATKKPRTFNDRKTKLNKMLAFLGDDTPVSDLYIDNDGRRKFIDMQEKLFYSRGSFDHARNCRGLLKRCFDFATDKGFFKENQNPATRPDATEKEHIKRGNPHLDWSEVPDFLTSVSENNCGGDPVVNLATKAHLLMCSRVGWVARLEWTWFDEENDRWIIPSQTSGLKKLLNDDSNDFIVPNTYEINELFAKIKKINGWQKYVFKSYFSNTHIHEESINNHIRNLGYAGKQTAHGWRDVVATAGQEVGGFSRDIVERCLAHSPEKKGAMGHYDNTQFLDKRKEFLTWWSSELVAKGLKI